MNFQANKITAVVIGCLGLYSANGVAADIWKVNPPAGKSNFNFTTLNATSGTNQLAAITYSTASVSGATDGSNPHLCISQSDSNLDFRASGASGNVITVTRKVNNNGVVINNNLKAARCSEGKAEKLNNANCGSGTPSSTTDQLYYQVELTTAAGTSCDSVTGNASVSSYQSANFRLADTAAACSTTSTSSNFRLDGNKIVATKNITSSGRVFLCGTDLNTGLANAQELAYTITSTPPSGGGSTNARFTKLNSAGQAVADSFTGHHCVLDNRGTADTSDDLIWEVKQNNDGLHDSKDIFTWFYTGEGRDYQGGTNNGIAPFCYGNIDGNGAFSTYCNTQEFTRRVNEAGWCGSGVKVSGAADAWRVPNASELASIHDHSQNNAPYINRNFFPNNRLDTTDAPNYYRDYWARELMPNQTDVAKSVVFHITRANPTRLFGNSTHLYQFVRLVRSAN